MSLRDRELVIDHEELFQLIHARRWSEAAAVLHRHHQAMSGDPLLHRASEAFVQGVGPELEKSDQSPDLVLLEKLFLLHQGGFLRLPSALFERVVVRLVEAHADRPEAAIAYARYCAGNSICAAVLSSLGSPERERIEHGQSDAIDVVSSKSEAADASRTLFRSKQEEHFFRAVREVFPTYLVYPNVALSAVLDFEAVEARLSRDERHYFFRALLDCVVFDQHDRYRPLYFFELDSPLHDDASRRVRDLLKDRILAAGGQHLYRIRSRASAPSVRQFAKLIRETVC